MYSKATIGGHPIHPMLIAFPVAFYTASFVSFLVYAGGGSLFSYRVGFIASVAGVIMALVAAVPGFIDWAIGIPSGTEAKRDGVVHASLNVAALILFAINVGVTAGRWNDPAPPVATGPIVLTLLGVCCTVGAGWFGWRLVQTHHVGVQLTRGDERYEPMVPERGRGRDIEPPQTGSYGR